MKKKLITSLVILVTLLFSIASCKKEAPVEDVDLAQSAQGTYEVYYLKSKGQEANLPQNAVSATVYVNRTDKNTINMNITLRDGSTGESKDAELGSVQLKKESSTTAMYSGTEKVGTINNNELEINGKDEEGQEFIIKARK